ncbi:hypothetical protein ACS0TY_004555 [Phlomoides rotata]
MECCESFVGSLLFYFQQVRDRGWDFLWNLLVNCRRGFGQRPSSDLLWGSQLLGSFFAVGSDFQRVGSIDYVQQKID